MNCREVQAVLVDYLDQALDVNSATEVKKHLEGCELCRAEELEVRELLQVIRESSVEQPGPALRANFNTMLQSELNMQATTDILKERKQTRLLSFSSPVRKVAAAVILVAGGIGIGVTFSRQADTKPPDQLAALQREVKEMKEVLMFSLIDDESASQRIKAVNYAEEMANPDQQVIGALINTLNNDKNVNVRLASLYSLARFSDNRTVRDSLVTSLSKQTEPIIQVVLINLLAEKRDTRAIAPIRDIMTNKKTLKEVKDAAQRGLKIL